MRLDFLRRWLNEPVLRQLEDTRRDLAVATDRLGRADLDLAAARATSDTLRIELTNAYRLVAELKRAGFVADTTLSAPRATPADESEEERELWDAIYQRAPRGSQMASLLYQHAQSLLAAEEPLEHVIGSILEGGEIDLADLEEQGV